MKVAAWVAAAIAAGVLLFFLFDGRNESASSLSDSPEPAAQNTALESPAPRAEVERATTLEPVIAPVPSAAAEMKQPVAEESKLAAMKGRFLLPDGNPAIGVKVKLWAFECNDDLIRKHGRPKDWKNQESETDAEGKFEFFFDPPQAYQFFVDAKLAGCAEAKWRWGPLPRGETTNLGTITLAAGGRVAGRLTDKDGRGLYGDWYVRADSSYRMSGSGGDNTCANADVDPQTGAFVFEDLPPGSTTLQADSRQSGWIAGPTVEVRPGETVEANIVYEGPDNRRRITVVTFCRPPVFDDEVESVVLHGTPSGPISANKHGTQRFSFDDLDPNLEYRVEIRGPKVQSFTKSGLKPGNSYDVMLVGSAAVALEVVDAASGEAVEDYRLTLRYRNVSFFPNEFEIREPGAEAPEHGLYRIVPGDVSLIVETEGTHFAVVDLDAVAPNATRSAVARLSSGSTLAGKVVQARGAAVAGAKVELWPTLDPFAKGEEHELDRLRWELSQRDELCKETIADAAGAFSFAGLTPGFFEVTARQGEFVKESKVLKIPTVDQQPVVLELPNPGFIVGHVTGISERALSGLVARVERVAQQEGEAAQVIRVNAGPEPGIQLDSEGRFRLGPLAEDTYQVYLRGPGGEVQRGSWGTTNLGGIELRLATVKVRAGVEVPIEMDLTAQNPGYVVVDARREEGAPHPAAGVVVIVQRIQDGPRFRTFARSASAEAGETGGQTDANGKLILGPIFPGEWEITAETVDQSWSLNPPQRVKMAPGEDVAIELRVQVFEHVLEVLDAETGKPCVRKVLMVEVGGYSSSFETDDLGKLQLRLGPGKYALWEHVDFDFRDPESRMKPRPEPKRYEFEWTAGGPVPAVLRIARESKD